MSLDRAPQYYPIFTAKGTTGVGQQIFIGSDRNQAFSVYGAGTITATIKVRVSSQEDVDLTAVVSATNRWSYADLAPSNTAGVIIDGDTGLTWAGTAGNFEFEINQNCYTQAALEITAISGSGAAITASMTLTSNQ